MKRQCCLSNLDDAEIVYSPGQKNQPQFKETDFSPTASDFGIFYKLARCKNCGALFAVLEGEGLDLRGLYSSSRDSPYLSQGPSRNRISKRVFDDIKGFIPRGGRLLDVGCSYGFSVIKSRPYQKTFTLGYLISQFFRAGYNKLFYRLWLSSGA